MGTRTSLTNARGKTTTFSLDNASRVVRTDYPDATHEEVTYNADEQIATRTDGRGYVASHTYDTVGRLTGVDYPTGTDTSIQYLANDTKSQMTDRSGTTLWVYNARDEVLQVNAPQGTINYTYFPTGQRNTVGRSGGGTTTYTLDNAGRVTGLVNGYSEATSFTLDGAGRITQQTHANGTYLVNTYSSTRGWLTAMEHRQSNHSVLARYEYTRDNSGAITAATQPTDHAVAYAYDAANQLTGETRTGSNAYAVGYTYDAAGNRLTKTQGGNTEAYTYGDNNQLLSAGTKTYAYDNNGNLTGVTTGGLTTALAWDFNNKLTGITYPGGATNTFVTNDLGHRVSMADSAGTTSYLFDGSAILADSRADYTNGGDAGIISERAGSVSKIHHADQLGSTRGLTNATQSITDSREYDAWGQTVAATGTGTPFGFAGGQGYQTDLDSGLMLLGARYYDPSVGRFISRDPMGYRGGDVNLYGYCQNDPVGRIDPSGLLSWIGVVGGVLGAAVAITIVGLASPFLLTAIVIGAAVGAGLMVWGVTGDAQRAAQEAAEAALAAYMVYYVAMMATMAITMSAANNTGNPGVPIYRAPCGDQVGSLQSTGYMEANHRQYMFATPDPRYAAEYTQRNGTGVWTTTVSREQYEKLVNTNWSWSDGGNPVLQVPYRLENMYSDFFNGWKPNGP